MITTDGIPTIACPPVRVEESTKTSFATLYSIREPDLERSAGDGFLVRLYLLPEFDQSIVEIVHGPVVLDQITRVIEDGLDVYRHTALYSRVYAEAVR